MVGRGMGGRKRTLTVLSGSEFREARSLPFRYVSQVGLMQINWGSAARG